MSSLLTFLTQIQFAGNSAYDYTRAFLIFLLFLIIGKLIQAVILQRVAKFAQKTENTIDDAIIEALKSLKLRFFVAIALLFSLQGITIIPWLYKTIFVLLTFVVAGSVVRAVRALTEFFVAQYLSNMEKEGTGDRKHAEAMLSIFSTFVMVGLWIVAILLIVSNLGVNVTSLVASLGIGGIAIALALQNVLSDMFSSFSIFIDKPFQVGDAITVDGDTGTVTYIGLKSTRIQLLRGEELVLSNRDLTSMKLQNLSRLERRRVALSIGITYETDPKEIKKLPEYLKDLVENIEGLTFSRCHLSEYGSSAILFELVYFVEDPDYSVFMDTKHAFNVNMLDLFTKKNIDFAYPTQTIFVKK